MAEKVKADGYIYLTTGEFIGKFGTSTKVLVATKVTPKQADNKAKIEYDIQETKDINIDKDDFCYCAGVIYNEDKSSWESCAAITQASLNMIKLYKDDDKLALADQVGLLKTLLSSSYSTASNKDPRKYDSADKFDVIVRKGLIHTLTGGDDKSSGAVVWDGIDFASKGAKHNKATVDGGISITLDLWEKFVGVCLFKKSSSTDKKDPYYGKDILAYGKNPQTKEEVLKNIPFLTKPDNVSSEPITIYLPKSDGNIHQITWDLYESVGTGTYNKGRTLYRSAIVRGQQIYWRPNKEHVNNKGYIWKYFPNQNWFKIIFLAILLFSCQKPLPIDGQIKTPLIKDSYTSKELILFNGEYYNTCNYLFSKKRVVVLENDTSIFEADTAQITSYTYELKDNYNLSFLPVYKDSTSFYLIRLKGNDIDTIIENFTYDGILKYIPYYKHIDFDDYFCISQSGGSAIYTSLIEKATGSIVLYGEEVCYDTENQLLIFREDINSENRNTETDLTLYDVKNKKKYPIYTYSFNDPAFGAVGTLSCYSIDKVTDKEVYIKFNCGNKKSFYSIKIKR